MIWWWLWLAAAAGENAAWPATDSRTISGTSSAAAGGGGPGTSVRPTGAGASNEKLCIVTPIRLALPLSRVARSSSPACSASPRSSSNSSASGGSAGIVISWVGGRARRRRRGQPAEQLEQLGQRRIGRNRDFVDGVQVEPLQQRISVDGRAVDRDTAVLRENDRALGLEQTRQRATLRFLFLFGGGITEQLERA